AVPHLISELHEPEHDMASLLGLCHWMERYSPWVALEPPDGLLLDITGIPHLFGGEAKMLAGMRQRLARYGYTARIAVAETIGAAWAFARYAPIASSQRKPGSISQREDSGNFPLEKLPIEALRIDADAARTLRRLGLKTIGAVLAIPRASLARRFRGETVWENVLQRLDEATGCRDEPLNPLKPPASFVAHRAFMEPVITPESLEVALTGLVTTLSSGLEKNLQGVTRLIFKLFRTDGSCITLCVNLSAPSYEPAHLLRLLKPKLETIDAGFGIDAMALEALEMGHVSEQQYGFREKENSSSLEQLNDRVINRHEAEITVLQAVESHIPERAEIPQFRPPESRGLVLPGKTKQKNHRPLLIFNRPEPASVIAEVPDGPPMRFTWRRVTRRVTKSRGPERIAPEWWRLNGGQHHGPRDYYLIEDEPGRRYWLYREGFYGETQPKWFVHGLSP
ncbi:MAG TPA: DNA polymerase Y family protein, partial [Aestuariivirga sp.]|nr:DNA polymerase Y family protein [Aestuariivirga sp.]